MSRAAQRINKEYQDLTTNPVEGFEVSSSDPSSMWNVEMVGPEVKKPF